MGGKPRSDRLYEFRVRRLRASERLGVFATAPITLPERAADLLRDLTSESPKEEFYAFYLDAQSKVIGYELIAVGTLTGVDVHPREVFRGAILASAASILISHNHPSGSTELSDDDIALTKRMMEAGEILGIPVLDHVIAGPEVGQYCSYRKTV